MWWWTHTDHTDHTPNTHTKHTHQTHTNTQHTGRQRRKKKLRFNKIRNRARVTAKMIVDAQQLHCLTTFSADSPQFTIQFTNQQLWHWHLSFRDWHQQSIMRPLWLIRGGHPTFRITPDGLSSTWAAKPWLRVALGKPYKTKAGPPGNKPGILQGIPPCHDIWPDASLQRDSWQEQPTTVGSLKGKVKHDHIRRFSEDWPLQLLSWPSELFRYQ